MHQTESVARMKSVYSPANVFARHHSFWIQVMETNVRTHANDTLVESMPSVHHPILRNVCVRLASRVIHCKAVSMRMSVQLMEIHAHMGHSVSIKKVDTNVYVRMDWQGIHIKKDASQIVNQINAAAIKSVLILWLVYKAHVLAHAKVCYAVKMHTVNQKIMQLGADAALVSLKTKAANVFHVRFLAFIIFFNPLECRQFCGLLMT